MLWQLKYVTSHIFSIIFHCGTTCS